MARVTVCSDFGAQENQDCHCFHCFPNFCHEVMGPDAMIFIFWMLSFKPALSLFSFTFIKRLFNSTACMSNINLSWKLPGKSNCCSLDSFKNEYSPNLFYLQHILGFPGGSIVKNPPANARDTGLIPGLGVTPGEGNDNPLQYSCLGNPMYWGAW